MNANACMEKLLEKMKEYNRNATETDGITIACGMARFENDGCVASVLERADYSMYENKKTLKNVC